MEVFISGAQPVTFAMQYVTISLASTSLLSIIHYWNVFMPMKHLRRPYPLTPCVFSWGGGCSVLFQRGPKINSIRKRLPLSFSSVSSQISKGFMNVFLPCLCQISTHVWPSPSTLFLNAVCFQCCTLTGPSMPSSINYAIPSTMASAMDDTVNTRRGRRHRIVHGLTHYIVHGRRHVI